MDLQTLPELRRKTQEDPSFQISLSVDEDQVLVQGTVGLKGTVSTSLDHSIKGKVR